MVVHAKPSFYANRGTLSLYARDIRMVGLGELLARIERRRQLLAAEGLFAAERKRRLPFLPGTVGLVTAPNSAAERDVLENARRRWPAVRFAVRYAAMQGTGSAAEVIEALGRLDRDPEVDVIVVARGGGSVEDLLPFSDEGLLRAVFAARTPVVSAIGHEPDSPLLDLVADVRASTPTDAAKLVVPDVAEELARVDHLRQRGRQVLTAWLAREQHALDVVRARPIVVPCHRVTAAGGKLGGFSARGGVNTKVKLLAIEGAEGAGPRAAEGPAGVRAAALAIRLGGLHPPVELGQRRHRLFGLGPVEHLVVVAIAEHVAAPERLDHDAVAPREHARRRGSRGRSRTSGCGISQPIWPRTGTTRLVAAQRAGAIARAVDHHLLAAGAASSPGSWNSRALDPAAGRPGSRPSGCGRSRRC